MTYKSIKNELEFTFIETVNPKKQILLRESFTDIHLLTLLTLISIT